MSKFKNIDRVVRVHIPADMEDKNIRVRRLRFSDGLFIMNGLKDEVILNASGLSRPIHTSWFSLWWWIKKTFIPAYCIECDSKPIGFIGLYDLKIGESTEISLAIFDNSFRRRGYGTRAFKLLALHLQRHSVVRKVRAKVMRDNHHAISFWRRAGFTKTEPTDDVIITMSMDLNKLSMI